MALKLPNIRSYTALAKTLVISIPFPVNLLSLVKVRAPDLASGHLCVLDT